MLTEQAEPQDNHLVPRARDTCGFLGQKVDYFLLESAIGVPESAIGRDPAKAK